MEESFTLLKISQVQKVIMGAGKTAWWLGALAALQEDPNSIPSTQRAAHRIYDSSPEGSVTLFWSPQALGTDIKANKNPYT